MNAAHREQRQFSEGDRHRAGGSLMLAGAALALAAAFVVAPIWLTGGTHGGGVFDNAPLQNSAAENLVAFWRTGDRSMPAGMSDLVDHWMRYHVWKAVFAGLATVVLAVLATRLWRSFTDGTAAVRTRRVAGVSGATAAAGGLGAALLLMANVQGAIAPLSSVLSLVPSGGSDPDVVGVRAQVAQELRLAGTPPRPALARMISDFGTYHAVLAASAIALACAAVVVGIVLGRSAVSTVRTGRAARRTRALTSALFATVGVCAVILAAANIGNAVDPAHALLLFYGG